MLQYQAKNCERGDKTNTEGLYDTQYRAVIDVEALRVLATASMAAWGFEGTVINDYRCAIMG
jgi:hypothetical protein